MEYRVSQQVLDSFLAYFGRDLDHFLTFLGHIWDPFEPFLDNI